MMDTPPQPGGPYPPQPGGPYQPPGGVPAGPPGYYSPPAAPPRRGRRSGTVVLVIIVLLLVGVIGGLYFFRDRISGGVGDLAVGDCIDEPSQSISISEVQHRPCSDPHDGEVFYVLRDPAGDAAIYPGADYFREAARTACLPASSAYIGEPIAGRDDIDIGWFYPTSSSWSDGDRGMTCYLYRVDGSQITDSLKTAAGTST